jgi:NAD(P)H dehydrogenase (quinone)
MKTLIITAHPSKFGFTQKIAQEYAKASLEKGNEVEILDLYQGENRQDFLMFEDIKEMPVDPTVERMQKKITESDELVFVFPVWWYAEPAIMKNFLDKNFSARYAYHYVDGKPKGLLGGKTARVFVTADGPQFLHFLLGLPIRNVWWLARLRFCGIKMKSFTYFGEMRIQNEESRKKMLEKVYQFGKK